jgi:hypothetical protein
MFFATYVGLESGTNERMRLGCHLIVKSLSRRTELTSITLLDRKRILRNFATRSTFTIRNLKFEEEVEEGIETEENQNDAARPFKKIAPCPGRVFRAVVDQRLELPSGAEVGGPKRSSGLHEPLMERKLGEHRIDFAKVHDHPCSASPYGVLCIFGACGCEFAVQTVRFGAAQLVMKSFYFVTKPQAMRSPALPAGSVFMSSALA